MVAIRNKRYDAEEAEGSMFDNKQLLTTFPPENERKADIIMQKYMIDGYASKLSITMLALSPISEYILIFRSWQSRRFIYTKEAVYFSAIDEEVVIDVIPIVEIVEVNKVSDGEENTNSSSELQIEKKTMSKPQMANVTVNQYRLQIVTDPDGYNSGRKYVLRASSDEACEQLIKDLTALSKIEKKKAERRSKFQRTQAKTKRFFLSNGFHVFMSTMILVVSGNSEFRHVLRHMCVTLVLFMAELLGKRCRSTNRNSESRWIPDTQRHDFGDIGLHFYDHVHDRTRIEYVLPLVPRFLLGWLECTRPYRRHLVVSGAGPDTNTNQHRSHDSRVSSHQGLWTIRDPQSYRASVDNSDPTRAQRIQHPADIRLHV